MVPTGSEDSSPGESQEPRKRPLTDCCGRRTGTSPVAMLPRQSADGPVAQSAGRQPPVSRRRASLSSSGASVFLVVSLQDESSYAPYPPIPQFTLNGLGERDNARKFGWWGKLRRRDVSAEKPSGEAALSRPLVIAVACWVGAPSPGPARSRLQVRATTARVEIDRVRAHGSAPLRDLGGGRLSHYVGVGIAARYDQCGVDTRAHCLSSGATLGGSWDVGPRTCVEFVLRLSTLESPRVLE